MGCGIDDIEAGCSLSIRFLEHCSSIRAPDCYCGDFQMDGRVFGVKVHTLKDYVGLS